MSELNGQVALVTGASRGIGAACARRLAEAGMAVALTARSSADIEQIAGEIREAGGRAIAVPCDVASFEQVSSAVAQTLESFARLDVLVNNAGVIDPIAHIADSDPEAWSQVVDINLKGAYYAIRACLPAMLEAGHGVIVNVSSGAATSALEGWSHYCATKAGLLSLTSCTDLEYRDQGIRVVGLSPGTVATEMQVSIRASGINPVSELDPSVHISPDAAARAVVWLCTRELTSFPQKSANERFMCVRAHISPCFDCDNFSAVAVAQSSR